MVTRKVPGWAGQRRERVGGTAPRIKTTITPLSKVLFWLGLPAHKQTGLAIGSAAVTPLHWRSALTFSFLYYGDKKRVTYFA